MERANRDKWLGTLEIIAVRRPDEAEAEWAWVMKELALGPEYFLAIYEVVKQGRWREAENPGGYVKASARREARELTESGERKPKGLRLRGIRLEPEAEEIPISQMRMEGVGRDGLGGEELLDHLEYRQESGKPTPEKDNIWRSAPGLNSDGEGLLRPTTRKPSSYEKGSFRQQAERLMRLMAAHPRDTSNDEYVDEEARDRELSPEEWQEWAERAGLNEWEKKAIQYKASGVGWTKAMAEQPDDESRRALQAAWRKVERTGEERLRSVASPQQEGEQDCSG